MQSDISKKIGQATKWSSITEIATKLISPIVNMILARLLAPEAFGVVATITMVISFSEIFTDAGFQKYIIQHEFRDDDELDKSTNVAFLTNLFVSLLICAIIFAFRHSIAVMVGSPGLGNSISIASILILIAAFSSIQIARNRRSFDFKILFYARIVSAFIPVLITIPLAFVMRNYWALLIGNFVSQGFSAIVLTWKSKWKPSFYYNFSLLKQMLSFSVWTLFESIAIWLTSYIDIFLVGSYLNEYYLGIYKTSMSVVSSCMAIITGAITPVLFSALSRYQDDAQKFSSTYYTFQRNVAILVFPLGVGIFCFKDLVTYVLLGSQWMEASGFIGLWGLTSSVVIVFSYFSSEVFRSKGNPKISLFTQLLYLTIIVPALLISIRYNFEIFYTVRALIRLIMISMLWMHFLYKFKISDVIKNVFPMMLSSLVMGLAGYGLLLCGNGWLWQILCIVLCIIVYFSFLFLCFPKTRKEVFSMAIVQKIFQKVKR